ncbi:MAG: hybrid sensor histidine kinase/response regulator [Gammaproteobacteria bacterium]|nr:hybrid sensor histidine kinase/response regulator [Gammaproteobacteria bacterium]
MKQHNSQDRATAEQAVNFVYANLVDVSRIQIIFPVIIVALFWGKVDTINSVLWCACSTMVYLARILLTVAYRKRPKDANPYIWGHYFTVTSLISGLLWGLAAFLYNVPNSSSEQIFLIVLIVGTAAGASIISSYWMPGYLCFAIPAVSLTCTRLIFQGDTAQITLGIALFLYLFILIGVARKTRQAGYDVINLRFQNVELIERLEGEKDRAETASRAKTQFLASANHDLRQPVHALSLISYSLKDELVSERGKNLYQQLDHTVGNLNSLLASLLDLSQLDAGALKAELSTVKLRTIAAQIYSEYSSVAAEKNLALRIHTIDASIRTDHTLILRLIGNLLSNAIRYTDNGGILLGFRRRKGQIMVEIWDTGMGIHQDQIDSIFSEFYQIEGSKNSSDSGLGLGLAICQRIAELLDTRIELSSTPGRGSVFRFTVPEVPHQVTLENATHSQKPEALQNTTALVIDDDLMGLNAVAAVLAQHDVNLLLAQSSERAMEQLDQLDTPLDFILSDFRLAGELNGVELVREIQNRPGFADVPAMIMTGDTAKEVLSMLDSCNLPVLNKPVSASSLLDGLNSLLKQ